MSVPVIRRIGGNYRAYRNGDYIGGGRRREEGGRLPARGHRSYIGAGSIHQSNDMAATVERRAQELLRRELWLHCERAPFDRAHP